MGEELSLNSPKDPSCPRFCYTPVLFFTSPTSLHHPPRTQTGEDPEFTANLSGGDTDAEVYWMNDATNLYLAVRVRQSSLNKVNKIRFDFDITPDALNLRFFLTLQQGNGAQGNTQFPNFRSYQQITIKRMPGS